jgi:hypothetical protein
VNVPVIGHVKFQVLASLFPWQDADDFVLEVQGRIRAFQEPRDEFITIGKLRAFLLRSAEAENAGLGAALVAREHSDELAQAYNAIFEKEEPQPELEIYSPSMDLVYIERIELKRRYRQTGVAADAIKSLVGTFDAGLAVASRTLDLTAADRAALGFMGIGGTALMFLDCSRPWPRETRGE